MHFMLKGDIGAICQVWSVEQNSQDELFIVLDLSLIYAAVTHKKKSVHFKW